MRIHTVLTWFLLALPLTFAQSSTTTSSASRPANTTTATNTTSTTRSNSSFTVLTTTLTSYPTTTFSGSSAQPSTLVLTLTLNTTDLSSVNASIANGSFTNGTAINTNGTINDTGVWEEGDAWIPFHIVIDPAYGILGALLILSGIPVAVLGGKNRWSSLAISTGYCVMLFTLVMILRFGVEPNLQPPSPNPPSRTLRGLYLLACIIASFFGAGLGIFLFNLAKYWVSAAGGFSFGWFLLATKQGGLITSVLGRWGLLGGLTVAAFVASLPKITNPHMMLVSTAWIGATAFTLGVDCYTRAGLKEFYVYNLGFHDLFPKLNGANYPLTQTMMIELGILAAVVVIGAAIQFRVLNILQKRLKQMQEEEEARIDAVEVEKAAERFKNVGAELTQWEEKHGHQSSVSGSGSGPSSYPYGSSTLQADRSSVALPQLGFADETDGRRDGRPSSTLSLLRRTDSRGYYEGLGINSPTLQNNSDTPTSAMFTGIEELRSPERGAGLTSPVGNDPELESKLKLLEEVKRAREEVRGSLDKLRATTPTPSMKSETGQIQPLVGGRSTTPGGLSLSDTGSNPRRLSSTSSRILDYPEKAKLSPVERSATRSDWDEYLSERKVITPPALSGYSPTSMQTPRALGSGKRSSQYGALSSSAGQGLGRREKTTSMLEPRVSDFGPREERGIGTYPAGAAGSGVIPRERAKSDERPSTYHDYFTDSPSTQPRSQLGTPIIIGNAANPRPASATGTREGRPLVQRAMTYEELADRHRKRLSQMQNPITSKMREEVDLAEAKARWEKQQRAEKEEMKRKEREKEAKLASGPERGKGKEEILKSTEEWRRSVVLSPPAAVASTPTERRREKRRSTSTYFAS
ncbi:hypothetical protein CI109_102938 [Kwoniella shandongensis]|uniref:TM7S3/TM198-like domain-containing protein n=1 Tax=Kwoniella shandongensis TaxID=1734106 RepID=A0A5M6C819_9TREE|nr:uncharacterized protein CI109_000126 [Kwoniella shandongensis]KAA5531286.1 hypothetical protein CI109_000126 [Kwoniella shandongensis]